MNLFDPSDFADFQTAKVNGCNLCKLFIDCKNKKIQPKGKKDADVYVLLPHPTKDDDKVDLSGNYYQAILTALAQQGHDINNLRTGHSIRCHSTDQKGIEKAVEHCRQYIFDDIKATSPKVIFAVGGEAMKVLFGEVYSGAVGLSDIETLQGNVIPHRELKAWVVPIFTPQYVAEKQEKWQPQARTLWEQDIARGLDYIDVNIHPVIQDYSSKLKILTDMKEIEWVLYRWTLDKPKVVAFDYETTGIKPYREGHEIICVSICDGAQSYAFPFPLSEDAMRDYKKLMTDPEIKKIAHNAKFELMWTREKIGCDIVNLAMDTCLVSHLLCNKRGTTGLKYQTFINFGLGDYAKESKTYISSEPEKTKYNEGIKWKSFTHANCFNRMKEFNMLSNLTYCATDSWFTYQLAKKQVKEMKNSDLISPTALKPMHGFDLYLKGSLALADVERNGFRLDLDYLERTMQEITEEIENVKQELLDEPLIKEWQDLYGEKFNLDSGNQLGKFLYETKGYTCKDFTERGGYSTDASALSKLGVKELDKLIHYKKLDKILNVFLKGFYFERNGDILRPFYSLNISVSGRSSSSSPNMQNNSKHDGKYSEYVRKAIVPHKGHYLAELDYKSLEVLCGIYYHKDKTMFKYLNDPNSDQHADTASHLFLDIKGDCKDHGKLYNELGTKPMRQLAKRFNFATFFGSNYLQTAKWTWGSMDELSVKDGRTYKEYLKEQGISTFKQWEKHVQAVDYSFWNIRFKEYGAWRNKNYKDYQEKGYFDNFMGMRYKGVMAKTKTSNLGIQGSAFNIMLFALTKLNDWLKENGKKSMIIGQIHDSMLLSLEPSETKEVVSKAKEIMENWTDEFYDWITIPLEADIDIGSLDGDWTTLKAISYKEFMEKDFSIKKDLTNQ